MPTTATPSPVKKPALGRRSVSSHTITSARTSPSTPGELSESHVHKVPANKPHRAHVGGTHRAHVRSYSTGKNLNKLGRLASAQQLALESGSRSHQRKKSAPPTPAGSPRGANHVHWDGALEDRKPTAPMKKNLSTPALLRNPSGIISKKALVTERLKTSTGKKTVGFELADSDDEDGEWEDTTQSPESTRRSSVAHSTKTSGESSADNSTVFVDPLTFVKRPYPQVSRAAATSLPEPHSTALAVGQPASEEENEEHDTGQESETDDRQAQETQPLEHADIASRLLSRSFSARAPAAMSSISAVVTPAVVAILSRETSLGNLVDASESSHRAVSSPQLASASTRGENSHATSSSMEGGISRFIATDRNSLRATSRTDSDPNTPSSFLPHYHTHTPPSPNQSSGVKMSPLSRAPGTEPPSRTQQRLWLQRTATLNTSPPDSHGVAAAVPPSTLDPTFLAASQSGASNGTFDARRGATTVNGRTGGAVHDNELKHIRKAYEKSASELMVVRRFQSPTGDSFTRLMSLINAHKRSTTAAAGGHNASLGKPIKSAPALTLLPSSAQRQRDRGHSDSDRGPKQGESKKAEATGSVSQGYLDESEDLANNRDFVVERTGGAQSHHPSHRILSTSDEASHGHTTTEDELEDRYIMNETEMMIRRMWESREVATSG